MARNRHFIWNRRWSSLASIFTLYLSFCVLVISYQVISRMFAQVQFGADMDMDMGFDDRVSFRKQKLSFNRRNFNRKDHVSSQLKFSRHDVRLRFKELSPVPHDIHYDNTDLFGCIQNFEDQHDKNVTEDLWCQSRPQYLRRFKNPCYMTTEKGWYEDTICLSYFHVLGADKCGTTDFHSKLIQHPQIIKHAGNLGKESYYWCWMRYGVWMLTTIGRWKWYQYIKYFFTNATQEIVSEYVATGTQLITGDATPMDLWDFRGWPNDPHNEGLEEPEVLTPHLMRHMYKDPSFFVLLRDPVERLYSDYLFLGVDKELTPQDFARDVPISVQVMTDCLAINSTRQCFFSNDVYHRMPVRLHIGCYSIFLREWLSVFHRRNFFFIRTEQWHKNMTTVLRRAFEFLEVDDLTEFELRKIASTQTINVTKRKKKVGKMLPKTRALLTEFYAQCNEDLAKLLGDDHYLWKGNKT